MGQKKYSDKELRQHVREEVQRELNRKGQKKCYCDECDGDYYRDYYALLRRVARRH